MAVTTTTMMMMMKRFGAGILGGSPTLNIFFVASMIVGVYGGGNVQSCLSCVRSGNVYCRPNVPYNSSNSPCILPPPPNDDDGDLADDDAYNSIFELCDDVSLGSTPLVDELDCTFNSENGRLILWVGIFLPVLCVCCCLVIGCERTVRPFRSSNTIQMVAMNPDGTQDRSFAANRTATFDDETNDYDYDVDYNDSSAMLMQTDSEPMGNRVVQPQFPPNLNIDMNSS